MGHELGELGLAFVAHHALTAALEQEPVEAGQVVLELVDGGQGLAGRHLELLAAAFGIEVEGVEEFVIRQHRQGGELVGALGADRGHDRLHRPPPFAPGGMGGKAREVGAQAEVVGEQAREGHHHQGPLPGPDPGASLGGGLGRDHPQGQAELGQQRQHEAEVLAGHEHAHQQAAQGEAQPPEQGPALGTARPGAGPPAPPPGQDQGQQGSGSHQGHQGLAQHRGKELGVIEPAGQAGGAHALLVGHAPLARLVDRGEDR